jgi:peptidoglycan-N-acetylglucosamine deacetylase
MSVEGERSAAMICLTFDVDAEAGLGRAAIDEGRLLSTLSERRFGIARGLPRTLELLRAFDIPGTFYVPGATVERHRDAIMGIVEQGHELGHHGHDHLRDVDLTAGERRQEIERGLAALGGIGVVPQGYRSPAWELTLETLELLHEYGFRYDSSCMGDDRPYWEGLPKRPLLELPVHWSLDDWVHFGIGPDRPPGDLEVWRRTWMAEIDQALDERRIVTLTMHPEIIGRAHRVEALAALVGEARERGARFGRHSDAAASLLGAPTDALQR